MTGTRVKGSASMHRLLTPIVFLFLLFALSCTVAASFGTKEFESALDTVTSSELKYASAVKLLKEGAESFPMRETVIRGAQDYLLIQTFIFRNNPISQDLVNLLEEKGSQGTVIKFIYDWLGSFVYSPFFLCKLNDLPIDVRTHVAFWGDQRGVNRIWHEKIIVADGSSAIIGGMHFEELNLERNKLWRTVAPQRDIDIYVEGPIVKDIQDSFVENWQIIGGEELSFVQHPKDVSEHDSENLIPMRFVAQKPLTHKEYRINNLYVEAINAAKEHIYLETPFFSPAFEIIEALVAAARRGVDIVFLTNSARTLDLSYRYVISRMYYPVFLREGIKIFEMQGRMTHAKYAVFDGVYSIVGSYNLDFRSGYLDTECMLAFYSPELSEELIEWFEEGLTEAREVFSLFW